MGAFREERKSRPSPPLPISFMSWRGEELLLFSLAAPSSAPSDVVEMGWLSDGAHPPFLPHSLHTLFTSPTYSAKTIERTRRGRRNSPIFLLLLQRETHSRFPSRLIPLSSLPANLLPPPPPALHFLPPTPISDNPLLLDPCALQPKKERPCTALFFKYEVPLSLSAQSLFRQFFRSGSHYSRQKGSEDGDGTLSVLEELISRERGRYVEGEGG